MDIRWKEFMNRLIRNITSLMYSVVQIGVGLLLHPYQTMQSMVREVIFVWMSLVPSAFLGLVIYLWRSAIVPVGQLFFSCSQIPQFCVGLSFMARWFVVFCFYWQILLLYLLIRFFVAFRKK